MPHGYVHPLPGGDWTIFGTFRRQDAGTVIETLDGHREIRIERSGRVGWRVGEHAFMSPAGASEPVVTVALRRSGRTVEFSVDGRVLERWTALDIIAARAIRLLRSDDGGGGRDFAVYSMALPEHALDRLQRDAGAILRRREPTAA